MKYLPIKNVAGNYGVVKGFQEILFVFRQRIFERNHSLYKKDARCIRIVCKTLNFKYFLFSPPLCCLGEAKSALENKQALFFTATLWLRGCQPGPGKQASFIFHRRFTAPGRPNRPWNLASFIFHRRFTAPGRLNRPWNRASFIFHRRFMASGRPNRP